VSFVTLVFEMVFPLKTVEPNITAQGCCFQLVLDAVALHSLAVQLLANGKLPDFAL